jgi:hypothetical protein
MISFLDCFVRQRAVENLNGVLRSDVPVFSLSMIDERIQTHRQNRQKGGVVGVMGVITTNMQWGVVIRCGCDTNNSNARLARR